jgi:hypothetical protein
VEERGEVEVVAGGGVEPATDGGVEEDAGEDGRGEVGGEREG